MISQESIERVKAEANLVEVVGETVQLRRAGMYYSGLCPFHGEKSPSFFVKEATNTYTCFGCGASGNVISFVMGTRAMTFPDAVEYLASRFKIELKREKGRGKVGPSIDKEKLYAISKHAFLYFRRSLQRVKGGTGEFEKVGAYLRKRGLTADAINEFGIGYSPLQRGELLAALRKEGADDASILQTGLARRSQSGELYELFRGRLIFPIHIDSQRIVAFGGRLIPGLLDPEQEAQAPKYLNSPESPLYQKSRTVYGFPQAIDEIRATKEVYVVEGYMDVVGLWMAGVRNSVACCGTAITEQHIKRFAGICSRMNMLFDGDGPGRGAAAKSFLVSRNAPVDLAACFLPEGADPDDFARGCGDATPQALKELPRAELIDVYVESLFIKHGCSSGEKPGANLLGKMADEVAKAIASVTSEVSRTALISRASRRLGIDNQQLTKMVGVVQEAAGGGRSGTPATSQSRGGQAGGGEPQTWGSSGSRQPREGEGGVEGEVPSAHLAESRIRPVDQLPPVDCDIMRAVIILKGALIPSVLQNVELCDALQPETIRFVSELSEVLSQHDDGSTEQREAVKELLTAFGPSWIALWKGAFDRQKSGIDMQQVFQGSVERIADLRMTASIAEQHKILQNLPEASEEERLVYAEQIRRLSVSRQRGKVGAV